MKIRVYLVICISVLFVLNSCVDLSKDKDYNDHLSYFGDSLTSHFPRKYTSVFTDYTYVTDTVAHFNTEEINLAFSKANKQIIETKKEYVKNKIYNIDDNCVVVVNDFLRKGKLILDQFEGYQSEISEDCNDKYVVIPNFWDNYYANNTTKSKLDKNFKYLIIDSKEGFYSQKIDYNKSYMPDVLKHGYSKGIAFNEKEEVIIYWLVVW
ncbi:MAG: hypothetical protein LBQ84_00200 [Flavobacteriaceae bacterium]|nr:hypothetical protein [Flavobacteriaceae bacterium]